MARPDAHARPWYARPGFWLMAAAFVAYNLNLRVSGCGDDVGNRLLPLAILRHATVTLDPYRDFFMRHGELTYHVGVVDGKLISIYPLGIGILALPVFFVPAILWLNMPLLAVEKLAASLMATASVGLVYATLRRLGSPERQSLLLGSIYAFATPVFSIAAQALCQHPGSTLAVSATMYAAARCREDTARWVPLGALAAAAGMAIRPQLSVAVVPLLAYLVWAGSEERDTGPVPFAMAGALAVLIPVAAYNWLQTDSLIGGYALAVDRLPDVGFRANLLPGLAGLLVSPARGVLIYTPVVAFAAYGAYRAWRDRDGLLIGAALGALATLLLFSAFRSWWGGFTFGPRYLTEVMPLVVLLFRPVQRLARDKPGWAIAFLAFAGVSVLVQLVGVFAYPCSWDGEPRSVDQRPERVWNITDNPITRCVSEGFSIGGQDLFEFRKDLER